MFKYVWIIMLAIAAVIFIGYTIYAIYDSYCMAVRWATRLEIGHDITWLIPETFGNFMLVHTVLGIVWCFIFIGAVILTFVLSYSAYIQK